MVLVWMGAALAVRAQTEIQVHAVHPRLFFRTSNWDGNGPTLEAIRKRAEHPSSAPYLELLSGNLPNLALRGLLLEDRHAAAGAIRKLMIPIRFENLTTDEGVEVAWRSMAFDWLYNDPSFSQSDKEEAVAHIASGAEMLIRALSRGDHIFHTRMYGWATGIALAGLALSGHHPDANRFTRAGYEYYLSRLFPARQLQDGSVHNGFGYGRKYTMWLTGHFMTAWYTATGENLWRLVRAEQGDWARREMLFLIYGRYPNGSYLRLGDAYELWSDRFTLRALSERAAAYNDPLGWGFLKFLLSPAQSAAPGRQTGPPVVDGQIAYTYFLFFDPEAEAISHQSLPPKTLFSREGTGMVVWKSGWNLDDTTVFFKAGDYFGDHGHFDQGHVDVYRRVPLLIDSGSYLTFSGTFRMEYWRKTVAHNSILISDPEHPDEGGQRVFHSQDDSSMREYQANLQSETADILDYFVSDRLAYVAADLTAAYPRDRVDSVTRELAFLDDRFLLVRDQVRVTDRRWVPRVLWHSPVLPEVQPEARRFEVRREGARAIVMSLLPQSASLGWFEGFQVAGKRIEAAGHLRGLPDMGVGRMEVTASQESSPFYEFLHAIDISDDDNDEVQIRASRGVDGLRVSVGETALAFSGNVGRPEILESEKQGP